LLQGAGIHPRFALEIGDGDGGAMAKSGEQAGGNGPRRELASLTIQQVTNSGLRDSGLIDCVMQN